MATSWYVRTSSKIHGPFDSQRLKSLADLGKINHNTEVAKTEDGPWVVAGSIRGLFAPFPPPLEPPAQGTVEKRFPLLPFPHAVVIALAAVVLAIIPLVIWSSLSTVASGAARASVNGAVFLVDASGRPEKIGLVPVSLHSRDTLKSSAETLSQSITKRLGQIAADRKEAVARAEKVLEQASERTKAVFEPVQAFVDAVSQPDYQVGADIRKVRDAIATIRIQDFEENSLILQRLGDVERRLELLNSLGSLAKDCGIPTSYHDEARIYLAATVRGLVGSARYAEKQFAENRLRYAKYLDDPQMQEAQSNLMRKIDSAGVSFDGEGDEQWQALVAFVEAVSAMTLVAAESDAEKTKVVSEEIQSMFASLPTAIATAKTDGDGRFTIPIPARTQLDDVAVAAITARRVGDKERLHVWLLKVVGDTLSLSNDNDLATNPAEKIIDWPFGPP